MFSRKRLPRYRLATCERGEGMRYFCDNFHSIFLMRRDISDVCSNCGQDKPSVISDGAVSYILDLESRLAKLQSENEWIPVSERLPKDGEVWAYSPKEMGVFGEHFATVFVDVDGAWLHGDPVSFTHWRPLPASPESEG